MTISQTTDPLATYRPLDGPYDELLAPGEGVRQHWSALTAFLGELGTDELTARQREVARLLSEERVTYNITTGGQSRIRPWQVDAVPVVIGPEEWNTIELGLRQRGELLNLVLTDIYGPRRLIADGLIPPEVVFAHPAFLRECAGIRLPGPHQLFHAAFDIGRDEEGDRVVLADRTQAPSGAGYALENRIVVARVFPDLYRDLEVQRLAAFFRELRTALRGVAPEGTDIPRIVLLTPGPFSETAFEHAFLASYLGFPLVQGADLRVRDGRVWMRTLGRLEPVDVILRRVDATFCDPLELRPESHLGVPGLLEACREGTVSVVNTVGSGVLENPGLLPFLPRLSEVLLDEPLRMPSVTTWWCGDDTGRRIVLDRLREIIIRPIGRGTGASLRIGWQLSADELDDLRRRIEAAPHAWVGQESVALGAVPTLVDQGLEARRSVVRAFVVPSGDTYTVMPGGLTRVSTDPAASVITNQLGAVSKDTWVLASEPEPMSNFWMTTDDDVVPVEPELAMSARAAENLFWLGRYAERAEDLVRLLRVVHDRLAEFSPRTNPAGAACLDLLLRALTRTTGTFPGFVADAEDETLAERMAAPRPELRSLLAQDDRVGTVAYSIRRMLDAAGEVRDQLSQDTWMVVGHLDRDLGRLGTQISATPATATIGRVMSGLLALEGLAAESMVRDDGWQFLDAGRRIERAVQLANLLDATVTEARDEATDSLVAESMLTAAESIITYRRRYRSQAQIETVLDLLVMDPGNPRSIAYQVDRLASDVTSMPFGIEGDRARLEDQTRSLTALVHLADTNVLATVDASSRRAQLIEFLIDIRRGLTSLAAELDVVHFTHQLPHRAAFSTEYT